jgi:hypothetical protein
LSVLLAPSTCSLLDFISNSPNKVGPNIINLHCGRTNGPDFSVYSK